MENLHDNIIKAQLEDALHIASMTGQQELIDKALANMIEKGAAANIGEIHNWNGKKYRKEANGKWVEVSEHGMSRKEFELESKRGKREAVKNTKESNEKDTDVSYEEMQERIKKLNKFNEEHEKLSDKEHTDEEVGKKDKSGFKIITSDEANIESDSNLLIKEDDSEEKSLKKISNLIGYCIIRNEVGDKKWSENIRKVLKEYIPSLTDDQKKEVINNINHWGSSGMSKKEGFKRKGKDLFNQLIGSETNKSLDEDILKAIQSELTEAGMESIVKSAEALGDDSILVKAYTNLIEKAKRAEIGEIRTYSGVQYRKVSATGNPNKDWVRVKKGEEKKEEPKAEATDDKSESKKLDFSKWTIDNLENYKKSIVDAIVNTHDEEVRKHYSDMAAEVQKEIQSRSDKSKDKVDYEKLSDDFDNKKEELKKVGDGWEEGFSNSISKKYDKENTIRVMQVRIDSNFKERDNYFSVMVGERATFPMGEEHDTYAADEAKLTEKKFKTAKEATKAADEFAEKWNKEKDNNDINKIKLIIEAIQKVHRGVGGVFIEKFLDKNSKKIDNSKVKDLDSAILEIKRISKL